MYITIDSIPFILFAAYVLAFVFQLWYYLGVFSKLAFYKKKELAENMPPASIIICARNEDDNLKEFLPLLLNQDYPEYEVVVVNDCSFDNTGDILEEFTKKYDHLKIVTIKEDQHYTHGKKVALMVGIKGAKHEHLLFTDADCKPNSKDWIKHMMSNYSGETEIVLGYGAYEKKTSFVNKLIRFDSFYIALQYLSFCLAGKTYMGVGRNLSYKKSLFFKLKGFASHYHIESGDDDLFVNEAATKRNSKIEICVDSFTLSRVKRNYSGWYRQKRRHISTSKYYNFNTKLRLGLLGASQYLFFGLFIVSLIFQYQPWIVLSLFIFRLLIQMIIFRKSMDKLSESDLLWFAPIFEFILLFFYPILLVSNMLFKRDQWKMR